MESRSATGCRIKRACWAEVRRARGLEPREQAPNEACVVNQAPANDESAAAQAARELSRLQEETAQARAVLTSVQRDLAEARKRLGSAQANQLLEANEQLVLALLSARTEAEIAAQAFDKISSRPAQFDSLSDLP